MAKDKQPPQRVVAIPSDRLWLDPLLVTAATQFFMRSIFVNAGTYTLFAPANARRLMMLIPAQQALGSGSKIAAWPTNADPFLTTTNSNSYSKFTIFDFPGIVGNAWYINPIGTGTFFWSEVLRTPGG